MDTNVDAWLKAITQYEIEYPQVIELKKFEETDIAIETHSWFCYVGMTVPDRKRKLWCYVFLYQRIYFEFFKELLADSIIICIFALLIIIYIEY